MRVLLHICCAPCAVYPLEKLREAGREVTGFFYNPNIHPYSEYLNRKKTVEDFAAKEKLPVLYGQYDIERYFQNVIYDEGLKKNRCPVCWWMRLKKTLQSAAEYNFDAISTTLLISPYQEHEIIRSIGDRVCAGKKTAFLYEDFRVGFREGHEKAKQAGMYCQKYCGCLFSERERYQKKEEKKRRSAKNRAPLIQT